MGKFKNQYPRKPQDLLKKQPQEQIQTAPDGAQEKLKITYRKSVRGLPCRGAGAPKNATAWQPCVAGVPSFGGI